MKHDQYSNGKVVYTCNGAYSSETKKESTGLTTKQVRTIVVLSIVIVFLLCKLVVIFEDGSFGIGTHPYLIKGCLSAICSG